MFSLGIFSCMNKGLIADSLIAMSFIQSRPVEVL